MSSNLSYLDLIDICDNVQIYRPTPEELYDVKYKIDAQDKNKAGHGEHLVPFALNPSPESPIIGLLRPIIVQQLTLENERSRQLDLPEIWVLDLDFDPSQYEGGEVGPRRVSFQSWLDTPSKRTAAMREICERWRDTKLFDDVCGPKKWRAELYPIYADPFGVLDHPDHSFQAKGFKQLNFVFEMERSACGLFGVVTYGVHMSIYQEVLGLDGEKSLAVWVPTRARTKPTYV
jgi:hypothetical protein